MLIDFFLHLRDSGLAVSTREYLGLLEALRARVIGHSIEEFYALSRAALVKDESNYDKFDRAFGQYFRGIQNLPGLQAEIPEDWLRASMRRHLSPEDKARLERLGWDRLMEEFRKRLEEQKGRHAGGSRWIGTGGSSPFGHGGYHPEGIRVGGPSAGNRSAVKVWERREYANLDDQVELGTRNIKLALRRLRRFAREGALDELDLDGTVLGTARNAGWLDLRMRAQRHNRVKVLLFLDVGGSMDEHIRVCEELFSAARGEFKHLEHFYFHNCIYEHVWKDNRRRHDQRLDLRELMHKYGEDYKVVVVGDATMSPYEILQPGGALEYANEEPGATWLQRLLQTWRHAVWLNPTPPNLWQYHHSIEIVRSMFGSRMFPMTLDGLARAMRELNK
ncbi:VWA domain-containing protein [Thiomonas sp.]|uniref:vWA domain-containing protein n=1 Tax=Thiomonas sp. TaxID=2047785 RepID=UPI0026040973|nr:VWA domain-containing protein [Thiomonas sp.]